jgi:transposase
VHPKPIRHLRDLCRYRRSLVRERTREMQRVEQLLEDAQIKLSSVIATASGLGTPPARRAHCRPARSQGARPAGPRQHAVQARGLGAGALTGHFDDHHGLLCQRMLERIDAATATIDQVTAEIDRLIGPFAHQVAQLDAICGVGVVAARS